MPAITAPSSTLRAKTAAPQEISARLVLLLAAGAGLSVASLYYSQPMLGVIGADLGISHATAGLVPTLTQAGYAVGIFLLAPLGDRFDRRHVIAAKAALLALALLGSALSPGLMPLLVASLAIGLTSTLAQDIMPAAATLAPEMHRGKVVGMVMTGLLLGILLSRVVGGLVAEHFGWRTMYALASASIALFGVVAWRGLPRFAVSTRLGYGALLGSLLSLAREHGRLRRAALAQGLLAVGFSAFWSTLAVLLDGAPFHLGSSAAGAFGLAGVVAALAAPLAGRISDRSGPELVTRLGAGLTSLSFALMFLMPLLPPAAQLGLLVVVVVGFDLGFQVSVVGHQTIVYGIDPGARSRLNAVLFVSMFSGMAIGSAAGSLLLDRFGLLALAGLATASALAALAVRCWPDRRVAR